MQVDQLLAVELRLNDRHALFLSDLRAVEGDRLDVGQGVEAVGGLDGLHHLGEPGLLGLLLDSLAQFGGHQRLHVAVDQPLGPGRDLPFVERAGQDRRREARGHEQCLLEHEWLLPPRGRIPVSPFLRAGERSCYRRLSRLRVRLNRLTAACPTRTMAVLFRLWDHNSRSGDRRTRCPRRAFT